MRSNYHPRVKFSVFPQASLPPTLPLPRVPSGSLLLHSGCRPRSSEAIPGLPADSSGWGSGAPRSAAGATEKEAAGRARMPRRGGGGRRDGSRGGAGASGEGAQSPGPGLPRPSRRRLRTLSGYRARSARNNPPPSCCIANKILMSPLPLPLGRLLRSARGPGSSASRATPGSPVRSRPRPRGLSASLAAARSPAPPAPLPAGGRPPPPGL